MDQPAYVPLQADRYNPFTGLIAFVGKDLTGCTIHGQLRPEVNSTSEVVVNLAVVTLVDVTGFIVESIGVVDGIMKSLVRLTVTSEDVLSLVTDDNPDDISARYEIKITEVDGFTQNVYLYGPFLIRAGVDDG